MLRALLRIGPGRQILSLRAMFIIIVPIRRPISRPGRSLSFSLSVPDRASFARVAAERAGDFRSRERAQQICSASCS